MGLKISVIGTGYLGAVHAACMAELGHDVVGVDTDVLKIEALAAGRSPIFEPGLPELLASAQASGRLRWSTDIADVADADVHFVCVGTPQKPGEYAANTDYVFGAFASLAPHMKAGSVLWASRRCRWGRCRACWTCCRPACVTGWMRV